MKVYTDGVMADAESLASATLEQRVARLENRCSISEAIAHYARCVDARDAVGVASFFTEDGQLHGPGFPAVCGRAAIERFYGRLLPAMSSSTHLVSNLQIMEEDPASALAACVLWAWEGFGDELTFEGTPQGENRFSLGRYEFHFVREQDGQWRAQAMHVHFAGQTGTGRCAEHLNRPWPPRPTQD